MLVQVGKCWSTCSLWML